MTGLINRLIMRNESMSQRHLFPVAVLPPLDAVIILSLARWCPLTEIGMAIRHGPAQAHEGQRWLTVRLSYRKTSLILRLSMQRGKSPIWSKLILHPDNYRL
jgi:hypothetical protein